MALTSAMMETGSPEMGSPCFLISASLKDGTGGKSDILDLRSSWCV